jgi:hypothetical protein
MVAYAWAMNTMSDGDEIVLSVVMEHHMPTSCLGISARTPVSNWSVDVD